MEKLDSLVAEMLKEFASLSAQEVKVAG